MEIWILETPLLMALSFVFLVDIMPIRLIQALLFDFLKIRYAGWMDWPERKWRRFFKHLFQRLYILMRVILLSTAALDSCQGTVLIFILPSRYGTLFFHSCIRRNRVRFRFVYITSLRSHQTCIWCFLVFHFIIFN